MQIIEPTAYIAGSTREGRAFPWLRPRTLRPKGMRWMHFCRTIPPVMSLRSRRFVVRLTRRGTYRFVVRLSTVYDAGSRPAGLPALRPKTAVIRVT
jgi:hypothetical protein